MSPEPTAAPTVQVVAAIIESDGQILIGQRKNRGRHALKWEFPGGKVEPGEDQQTALARELREELGVEAEIGELIDRYEFRYEGTPVTALWFYRIKDFQGVPQNLDFQQILWVEPDRLPEFDFLEGDLDFIARFLASRKS